VRRYGNYYHGSRTHLVLDKDALEPRWVQPPERGRVIEIPEVGTGTRDAQRSAVGAAPRSHDLHPIESLLPHCTSEHPQRMRRHFVPGIGDSYDSVQNTRLGRHKMRGWCEARPARRLPRTGPRGYWRGLHPTWWEASTESFPPGPNAHEAAGNSASVPDFTK
jgi:hypothetical protein